MSTHGWANLTKMANDPKGPHYYRANELIAFYALGKPPQELGLKGAAGEPLVLRVIYDKDNPKDVP